LSRTLLYLEGLLHRERHLALRLLHTRAHTHTQHTQTHTHTQAHTLRGFCLLNGVLPCASSMDTNTHMPSSSHTHTHIHTLRGFCPSNGVLPCASSIVVIPNDQMSALLSYPASCNMNLCIYVHACVCVCVCLCACVCVCVRVICVLGSRV
jgi:hypothetical protein